MGVGVGPVGTEIGGALRGLSSVTRVSSVPGFFERILGGFYVSDLFLCFTISLDWEIASPIGVVAV